MNRLYSPAGPLAHLVQCFWYWEGAPQTHSKERLMPNGEPTIIFNLREDPIRIYDGDQLLAETGRTTTKPIARFKVRKPETRVSVTRHKDPLFGTDRHIEGGTPVLGRAGGAVRGPGY